MVRDLWDPKLAKVPRAYSRASIAALGVGASVLAVMLTSPDAGEAPIRCNWRAYTVVEHFPVTMRYRATTVDVDGDTGLSVVLLRSSTGSPNKQGRAPRNAHRGVRYHDSMVRSVDLDHRAPPRRSHCAQRPLSRDVTALSPSARHVPAICSLREFSSERKNCARTCAVRRHRCVSVADAVVQLLVLEHLAPHSAPNATRHVVRARCEQFRAVAQYSARADPLRSRFAPRMLATLRRPDRFNRCAVARRSRRMA